MKILYLVKKYPPMIGGDATAIYNLKKNQERLGNEVFVITTNCNAANNEESIYKFGLKDKSNKLDTITIKRLISLLFLIPYFIKFMQKHKPDLVHSHSLDYSFVVSLICKFYATPFINTSHGVIFPYKEFGFVKRNLEKILLKSLFANLYITVDQNSVKYFKKMKIKNVVYLPNAINMPEYITKKKKEKNAKFTFIFTGRLEKQKGLIYLLGATKILLAKTNNFQINIIGDGSQKKNLYQLIQTNGLTEYINLLGGKSKNEINELYNNSDAFVLPSLWEGFPISLLEAWSFSLPVIISDLDAYNNICVNKINALVFESKNESMLAKSMKQVMEDFSLATALGKNGKKNVEDKYNWNIISQSINNEYLTLLKNKNI